MQEYPSYRDSDGARDPWAPINGEVNTSIENLEQQVSDLPPTSAPSDSWEQLRAWCVGRMQADDCPTDVRVRWAHLALAAISKMSEADVGKAQEMVAAAARVRVYMIRQFGVSASDEARQPDRLCEDVLKNIGSSIDEVARLATDWRSLQREEMLYLRRLKNILTPLTEIADLLNPADSIHDEIAPWLALRPRLP